MELPKEKNITQRQAFLLMGKSQSRPSKKARFHMLGLINRNLDFIDHIQVLRKKFDVRNTGIRMKKATKIIRRKYPLSQWKYFFEAEPSDFVPEEWIHYDDEQMVESLDSAISALMSSYDVPSELEGFVRGYFFYGDNKQLGLRTIKYSPFTIENHDDDNYPVVLRMRADAAIRDLVDFVHKQSKKIKSIQERHRVKKTNVYKYRTSVVQNRNKFIYDHRHLGRKEIRKLIQKRFRSDLSENHISTILSQYKKN